MQLHTNDTGSELSNLFCGEEAEIYVRSHTAISTNDKEHMVLDTVIICMTGANIPHLAEFIKG